MTLLQFLLLQKSKVINYPIGWDTLHPFAPYSYGGCARKKFLALYRRKSVTTEEYYHALYGSIVPNQGQISLKFKISDCIKFWF